jgi:hypothetical protein
MQHIEVYFPKLSGRDQAFGAAMLLVARLVRSSGTMWGTPKLFA